MFIYNFFFKKKEVKVLLLGLDGSGKSCYLHRLMFNEYIDKVPQMLGGSGHQVFENHCGHFDFIDVSGATKARDLWSNYFEWPEVVVFAVDTSDTSRFDEVTKVLHDSISKIKEIPILILGTKIDLNSQIKEEDLIEKLKLKELKKKTVDIILVSSKTQESILDSMDWIISF
jgi:small GTP-binding protein